MEKIEQIMAFLAFTTQRFFYTLASHPGIVERVFALIVQPLFAVCDLVSALAAAAGYTGHLAHPGKLVSRGLLYLLSEANTTMTIADSILSNPARRYWYSYAEYCALVTEVERAQRDK